MKTEIPKNNIEAAFRQKVNEKKSLSVIDAVQHVIDFFNEYEIKNVDTSIPDNDMLLFQYGIYDWPDGKGENYTVDVTRQFYIENEESEGFSQLHLVLYFNSEEYKNIESANKWSIDFESIEEWKDFVTNSEGFKAVDGKTVKAFDIFLIETD